jgi:transcriptional regulator with XRE-family HTH domain
MGKEIRQMSFGQKLQFFRQKRHMTRHQLGNLVGIAPDFLNLIELGKRRAPSYPLIQSLAMVLEVDITDFIDINITEEDDLINKPLQ